MERIAAVVIGAGQAGLAVSHELKARGVEHVVLEAGELGNTWRTRRWRSFRIVSPNWLNKLPGYEYDGPEPDAFADTAELLTFLQGYADSFGAPIRTATPVTQIAPAGEAGTTVGFVLQTPDGELHAGHVIVATGAFGKPLIPQLAVDLPRDIHSIHTDDYWAPEDLPPGDVLVVGAGQAGLQIADELLRAGRHVTVAVGRHGWFPRHVYGKDQMYWRWEMGDFRSIVADPDDPKADYPWTPLARWGTTDFNVRTVWQAGARLVGHIDAITGTKLSLAPGLDDTLRAGDEAARIFVGRVFGFARGRGEDVPEPELVNHWRDGESPETPLELDLSAERIRSVVWSTGYRQDFRWIDVPGVLAPNGAPFNRGGVSPTEGIYFVGLHRMWEGGAGTILGCGWSATNVAEVIAERLLPKGTA